MLLNQLEIITLLTTYCPDISAEEGELFLSICKYKKVKSKTHLLKAGRTDKKVILILKGAARAYCISEGGQELNNYIRQEGKLVGDARVFGNDTQILDVESIGETHYLEFDIMLLEELGFENRGLMKFYLSFLKEIAITLSHRVNTFVTMNAEERYEDLVKWNPSYLKSTYDKHLASFLGIKPLTLYRVKNKK